MQEITFNWYRGEDLSKKEQETIIRSNTVFQWTRKMSCDDFQFDFTYYLVMYYETDIVGYIGLHYIIDEFQINTVYIDPIYRRRGFGTLLMKQLIERGQKEKVRRIILEVRTKNAGANKLYQSMKFKKIAYRKNYYHHPQDDAYILEYNVSKKGAQDDTNIIH